MNCPDTETLIAFAMNPLAVGTDELAEHIHGCLACRMNFRLVNESLLAEEWCTEGDALQKSTSDIIQKYIHILDRDIKDRNGRWLHKGDEVLVDIEDPTCFEKATDEAKKKFIENGYGFLKNLSPQAKEKLKHVGSEINRFGSAIAVNMKAMLGRTIPGKNLPWWVNLVPYPFTFVFQKEREITSHANRQELLLWLCDNGFLPKLETVSLSTRKTLEEVNFFRVWELTCGSICFRVFGVYVTPMLLGSMMCKKGDIALYNGIKQFIHDWEARYCAKANCKCYILGSACAWEPLSTIDLPDAIEILCSPAEDGSSWMVEHRDLSSYRNVFRSFVYALYPETLEQRRARVVKALESKTIPGSQTVEKLSKVCAIPAELVEEVFDDLQRDSQSGWMNYLTEDGKRATRVKADGNKGKLIFRKRELPLGKISLILAVLGLNLLYFFISQQAVKLGLASSTVLIAVASCAKGYMERKLT